MWDKQVLSSFALFLSAERFFASLFALPCAPDGHFSAVRRHHDPDLLRQNCAGHQVTHAHQVVGRAREGKDPIYLQRSPMTHFAQ